MPTARSKRALLSTLFFTMLMDMLGVGLIIPILAPLFYNNPEPLAPWASEQMRGILYGLLITSFTLSQFISAPIFGSLSDRLGRRPLLKVSLLVATLGYIVFVLGVETNNLWLLYIGRIIPGLASGNITIAYASLSDISEPETKSRNFALIGTAFGLAMIGGPALGGFLADSEVVSWFNLGVPFAFAAVLSAANWFFVHYFLPETLEQKRDVNITIWDGPRNIARAFTNPNLRVLYAVMFLFSGGFTFFTQFFQIWLIDKFSYDESDIGVYFSWIGIWIAITQGVLIRLLPKGADNRRILAGCALLLTASIFALLFAQSNLMVYAISPGIAIGQGIAFPTLIAIISNQGSRAIQGELLGINQSMQMLAAAIPPVIAGSLVAISTATPIYVSSGVIMAGILVFVLGYALQSKPKPTASA